MSREQYMDEMEKLAIRLREYHETYILPAVPKEDRELVYDTSRMINAMCQDHKMTVAQRQSAIIVTCIAILYGDFQAFNLGLGLDEPPKPTE